MSRPTDREEGSEKGREEGKEEGRNGEEKEREPKSHDHVFGIDDDDVSRASLNSIRDRRDLTTVGIR